MSLIKLSTRNFYEASKIIGNDEFSFIIGEEKITCHKFLASFLSKSISQILLSDPTVETFPIDLGNQKSIEYKRQKEEKVKTNLRNLILGENIEITEEEIRNFISELDNLNKNSQISDLSPSNISALLILNQSLKNDEINDELYRSLFSFLISKSENEETSSKKATKEEISQKILQIQKVEKFLNLIENQTNKDDANNFIEYVNKYLEKEYKNIIDEIALHFDILEEKFLFEMNENFLNSILSSEKLTIENEDKLLNILLNRRNHLLSTQNKEEKFENQFFIEKVEFEYLSENGIKRFLDEIKFEEISIDVWSKLKKRLILPVKIKTNNKQRHKKQQETEFKYNISNPFCGIFDHLTKISNGNIHTNNTIEFKSSDHSCGDFKELVDFQDEKGNYHATGNPTWIQIDFKIRKIQINSYLIKSGHIQYNSCNKYYLNSWKVEISSDGSNWCCVDERTNVSELNGNYKMHLFNLNKITEPFRFIRIITDQGNWYDKGIGFSIGKLEFYGNIIE